MSHPNEKVWLVDGKLLEVGGKVRAEIGPQVIEIDCTDKNLSDEVTSRHYKVGARDALGRLIRPSEANMQAQAQLDARRGLKAVEKGEKMAVVDWRAKHVPHVWKIYRLEKVLDDDGNQVDRFVKIEEVTGKEAAVERATSIAEAMQ